MELTTLFPYILVGCSLGGASYIIIRKTLRIETLTYQLNQAISQGEKAEEKLQRYHELERDLALEKQRYEALESRLKDWEASKDQAMQQAKAAMFEAGRQLSQSLIETHKKEAEDQQKKAHSQFESTSKSLNEQLNQVVESVSVLKDQVGQSKNTLDIVKRGLLSPTGAGSLAEISLENLLRNMGLQHGQDFIMQFTVSGSGGTTLRPDAVVFLPGNHVLIIDSKASKSFLELAEETSMTKEIEANLKKTMIQHLKTLYAKEYHEAVKEAVQQQQGHRVLQLTTVMYIPTDAALQKLQEIDPKFLSEAWKHHIYPAGPSTLAAILSHASHMITEEKRSANMEYIVEEVQKLVSTIHVMHGHAYRLGQGLKSSLMHFDKFSGSFNKNLGFRLKKLEKYGIKTAQKDEGNPRLQRYQLTSIEVEDVEKEDI